MMTSTTSSSGSEKAFSLRFGIVNNILAAKVEKYGDYEKEI
jgi:hypothetical protein